MEDNNGGSSSLNAQQAHNAYMLVYEKRQKNDIKILVDSGLEAQAHKEYALACDSTAMPSANTTKINAPIDT